MQANNNNKNTLTLLTGKWRGCHKLCRLCPSQQPQRLLREDAVFRWWWLLAHTLFVVPLKKNQLKQVGYDKLSEFLISFFFFFVLLSRHSEYQFQHLSENV